MNIEPLLFNSLLVKRNKKRSNDLLQKCVQQYFLEKSDVKIYNKPQMNVLKHSRQI